MSIFSKGSSTPFVATEKELVATFREQVLLIGDMRTKQGRPKVSILGNADKLQLTIDVGQQIVTPGAA